MAGLFDYAQAAAPGLINPQPIGSGVLGFPQSMRNYDPSWRDNIAAMMIGDGSSPLRKQMVERLMGSAGAGTQGMAPVDLVPGVGQVLGANEAYREGDAQGMALAVAPLGVWAKGAGTGLFDRSLMAKQPDVPQFDLPRNAPPRGVPQRVLDVTSDPTDRDKMLGTIDEGVKAGGKDWYNAEPLRIEFVRELGEDHGNKQFRRYMDFVAASSPRSEVGQNARNASFYYHRDVTGQGMPAVGDRNPAPYGHMAQRLHQMNANRVADVGWDPLNNPKPASFVENLVGNQAPVTVDTHAFRLPAIHAKDPRFLETAYQTGKDTPKQNIQAAVTGGKMSVDEAAATPAFWQAQPKANEYAALEQFYKTLAKDAGITPAQAQAAAWVGGGKQTGLASDSTKPFIGFLEDRVNLTAEKTGMDPKEVLAKFIRGQLPLLGVGGIAALGLFSEPRQ
jgi:hypothetical protein